MNAGPALDVEGLCVAYGTREVLAGVSLHVARGEVHAVAGENGAGKSTLLHAIAGLVRPSAGTVSVDGARVSPGSPVLAAARGVGLVHQHFQLVAPSTAAENVVLGAEPRTGPFGWSFDRRAARERTLALGTRFGLPVDPDARIESLSAGERQRVELLKVLHRDARILLLDEPTAALSPSEVPRFLETVRSLASGGCAVVLVTHRLAEITAVADAVTVLRRGRVVHAARAPEIDAARIAHSIVGGETIPEPAAERVPEGSPVRLEVSGLTAEGLADVSLSVARAEILGIAGVEGNGQKPLADVIAGLLAGVRGHVLLDGQPLDGLTVAERRARGVAYVPEDRTREGVLPGFSIAENLAMGDPDAVARGGRVDRSALTQRAEREITRFRIEPPEPWRDAATLSGGNAQKVLLARELGRAVKLVIAAQPTRGIDLGARARVHQALVEAAAAGAAVLLLSSDLDEIRALSHRVAVLQRGRVTDVMPVADATDARLGTAMTGGVA